MKKPSIQITPPAPSAPPAHQIQTNTPVAEAQDPAWAPKRRGRGASVPRETVELIIAGWRAGGTIAALATAHSMDYQTAGQIIARERKRDPSIPYRRTPGAGRRPGK